jgi:hypothetical protein
VRVVRFVGADERRLPDGPLRRTGHRISVKVCSSAAEAARLLAAGDDGSDDRETVHESFLRALATPFQIGGNR